MVMFMLPLILLWGIGLETYAIIYNKTFSMGEFFGGIGAFLALYGTFLAGTGGAILMTKTTDPDGAQTETELVDTRPAPRGNTTVIAPGSTIVQPPI